MNTTLTDLQKFTLTVVEEQTLGGVVVGVIPFGSVPVWASTSDAVATVLASADGSSAVVSSVAAGSVVVSVVVDNLRAEWSVDVVATPGARLTLTASAPEPK